MTWLLIHGLGAILARRPFLLFWSFGVYAGTPANIGGVRASRQVDKSSTSGVALQVGGPR